nr:MAG TPA: hypothetical protein [Caudoviricetes sp.]
MIGRDIRNIIAYISVVVTELVSSINYYIYQRLAFPSVLAISCVSPI